MHRWPHKPIHHLEQPGPYIVTSATYRHLPLFEAPDRRTFLVEQLRALADRYGWRLEAWAVMPDHYHFVGHSPENPKTLARFINHLHGVTARHVNRLDGADKRQVWHQYWDRYLADERAFLTRLAYVLRNPVRHGLVADAAQYPWCSAREFLDRARPELVKIVRELKIEDVAVPDDFGSLRVA